MTSRPALALVLITVLGMPDRLGAQDPRLRGRLDRATATRVERLIDSAGRDGLPTDPLIQKALEGRSKGAKSDRIVAAVEALFGALLEARSGLGSQSTGAELLAGALWLRAGGGPDDLARLRRLASNRPLNVPLAVSTELMSRGFSRGAAVESTADLLAARISDADFLALRDRVDDAVRQGAPFETAIRAEVARLRQPGRREP